MEILEAKVGSGLFLEALTAVNMEISRKRVERKRQRAVEKATNPAAAAERRRERTELGKVCMPFQCRSVTGAVLDRVCHHAGVRPFVI